ncbi:MAG TPA: DUF4288 domain-containing protein [Cytophagales bacterium]|nr:DUF4288 domain-containing protein [Cytophagales bacterium]HRG09115.1 DUF4288 domain-containing protein [Cyclobacteriaceae bacterium]
MNWYLVKLVFQIVNDNGTAQFDEQMRLIQADELPWAIEKARVLGWLEQSADVQHAWQFIDVADIRRVEALEDGIQLCAHTIEVENAADYIHLTRLNAAKAFQLAQQQELVY